MRTARFKGRVLPTGARSTLSNELPFEWVWENRNNALITFKVAIHNGDVDVECTVPPDYRDADMPVLLRRAQEYCEAVVGVSAFRLGAGLAVALEKFISPTGREIELFDQDRRLPPLCTALQSETDFDAVVRLVLAEPILITHLTDLSKAITDPQDATIICARVLDGIRVLVAPSGLEGGKSWDFMRDALNVEKDYLMLTTDASAGPRHGGERVAGLLAAEVVPRAWSVMNRFFEYRKRGNTKLTAPDFPTLKQ